MRIAFTILIASLLLLSGCEKEVKTWTVTYKVVNFENTPATYRVEFTNERGATEVRGPIDENWWISREITEVETGTELELLFDLQNGRGDFELFIEVNGSAIASESVTTPNTAIVLNAIVLDLSEG